MSPYALLLCATLRVVKFSTRDEWQTTARDLHARSCLFVALKWNETAQTYVPQEQWD